ncbi:MAG: glycosyltransferase [Candidatus Promineifilaceae bacterium]
MNILFITPYVPNLIRVRPYNFLRTLSNRGHKVSVLTLYTSAAEREDAQRLSEDSHAVYALPLTRWRSYWNCLLALSSDYPLQTGYCWQPDLANEISNLLANGHHDQEPFDVIHVEHLRGVRYALFAQQQAVQSGKFVPPVVWDSVDSISLLFREAAQKSQNQMGKIMTKFELKRTEKYEAWLASQLKHIVLTSPRDKEYYLSLLQPEDSNGMDSSITVVPNGVDLEYFKPDPSITREPASLVVSGKMSYHANIAMVIHLVKDIMPKVWNQRPETRLVIVGKDPSKEIRVLAKNPQVTVTGTVDDIRPYLQRATVAVSPTTYGAGIQNKVLEAMACATPTVASPIAVSALDTEEGQDLLVADNPTDFANTILELIQNPTWSADIGANGRHFVETNHDWNKLTTRLERIYQRATDRNIERR